jgi:hypothetical protein
MGKALAMPPVNGLAQPRRAREIAAVGIHFNHPNESPPMADQEAYCVKCKTKREVVNSREETFENGRRALRGQCAVCGTNITKFLSSK